LSGMDRRWDLWQTLTYSTSLFISTPPSVHPKSSLGSQGTKKCVCPQNPIIIQFGAFCLLTEKVRSWLDSQCKLTLLLSWNTVPLKNTSQMTRLIMAINLAWN
jgi:hypothetical protein